MKNFFVVILSMLFALFCFSTVSFAAEVSVKLDGNDMEFIQPPVIVEGRTLVPLRAIFEAIGATVEWDDETKTVISTKANTTVKLTIGSDILYRNGEKVKLDVPAQIMGIGYTMVPVRAVAEAYGVAVNWDDSTKTVLLCSPDEKKTHKNLIEYIMSNGEYYEKEYSVHDFWIDEDGEGHGVSLEYNVADDEVCVTYSDALGCVFMLVFDDEKGPHMFFEGDETNGVRIMYGGLKTGLSLSEAGNHAVSIDYFTVNDEDLTEDAELVELSELWIGFGCATAVLLVDNLILDGTGLSICEIYNLVV